ncbi:MAG: bifunctional 4-hydroxy-2-oxoglutarate aldolase/2-dehydro-3-deoxy-phosphogluconate aldolase [Candidatus Omnitrophica bacterium]|nr:bifunctional 4-hydroxy-2-oxoglutarate aldolase/2-dehydro-3-deoxy-phosphogluconate aldolase [Candidatus Omnitrophota bacterium]
MNRESFKKLPVLGILRGIKLEIVQELIEAIIASGLRSIELAMNTPAAGVIIKEMVRVAEGRLVIGAGTVLTKDDLQRALDSGASFIVLPVLIPEIVEYCVKNKIPVFPGALTPQEIYQASRAGATMVKVFPSKFFGPAYIKEIKAPLPDIELLACGGVSVTTIKEYFSNGASAVAFGASIFRKELLEKRQFSLIKKEIQALLNEINPVREQGSLTG